MVGVTINASTGKVKYGDAAITSPHVDEVRKEAFLEIKALIEMKGGKLTAKYPHVEVTSWPVKLAAAQAYIAGAATPEQNAMIENEASISGVPPIDLANIIVQKAGAFQKAAAILSGLRKKAYNAVTQAKKVNEIEAAVDDLRASLDNLKL